MRDPDNVKKKRAVGAKKIEAHEDTVAVISKGTTFGRSVQLISDTLDIMDEFPSMKGFHIALYNFPTHSRDVILERVI